MDELEALVPREDRLAERRILHLADNAIRVAMLRVCKAAGIPSYSPPTFDIGDCRSGTRKGVPGPSSPPAPGHSKASMSLDVYSHVIAPHDDDWGPDAALGVVPVWSRSQKPAAKTA